MRRAKIKLSIIFLLITIFLCTISAQVLSTKGQFFLSSLTSNDIPNGASSIESTLGYIPTFSFIKSLSNAQSMDTELAYRIDRSYSGDSIFYNNVSSYRYWFRYSNEKIEARIGLQKIVFGTTFMLRTLSWFDTIDPTDPTGQTEGVRALRLRWFPSNDLSLWNWIITNENESVAYGGRVEYSNALGEWGATLHRDLSQSIKSIGQVPAQIIGEDYRVAIDYRFDGIVGLWNESAYFQSEKSKTTMFTVGADYTLPFAAGILLTTEYMSVQNRMASLAFDHAYFSIMASTPLGMTHDIMLISQVDFEENRNYHYVKWSSTYDYFSLNFILSISPKRSTYNTDSVTLPLSLAGFGTGLQIMLIYNH